MKKPKKVNHVLKGSKNYKLAFSFLDYCLEHPNERFWQALRNWSRFESIYVGKINAQVDAIRAIDTFYFKGKNK